MQPFCLLSLCLVKYFNLISKTVQFNNSFFFKGWSLKCCRSLHICIHIYFTRSQPLSLCLSAKWRDQSRRFFLRENSELLASSLEFEDVIFGTKKGNNLQPVILYIYSVNWRTIRELLKSKLN